MASWPRYTRRPGRDTRRMPRNAHLRSRLYFNVTVKVGAFLGPHSSRRTSDTYPSAFNSSATATFNRLAGIRASSWRASAAFRRRANKSAMGSLFISSPTCLGNAREFTTKGHESQTNATEFEISVHGLGPPTNIAPSYCASRKLRGSIKLCPLTCTRHLISS